ncbi:MAG TPA: YchJ family metal-binding protein [Polaromonas sp.]|uniref:YchJ family protein n=1 Tax=Polaromonas sp. TaxID=1869339 RepID=UPI002D5DC673|nr:YchJ family metal-binding protein [Polaromonas sp.]HYW56242.1 YchJ family metal-binding protein [Polaromonas sp.]
MLPCPCGRIGTSKKALELASCCGPFINDFALTPAPDAHALMRSRYTAFVMERADYLLATWHTSQRPPSIAFEPGVKWLGLEVRQHRQLDNTHSEVEFVARQKLPGKPALRLHELSRFVNEQGRWYYVDGDAR